MPSPYVWQHPPRPAELFLPDGSKFSSTADKTWHRALWSSEAAMASIGLATAGFPDMIVSAHLQVSPGGRPFSASIIREALRLLRFEHPIIATRLACGKPPPGSPSPFGQPKLVYEAPASEDIVEAWLNAIVIDRSDVLTKSGDLESAVALIRRELGAALPVYLPSQLDVHYILEEDGRALTLLLRFGHASFDGIGSFVFLDVIIRKIAEVVGSDTTQQLALPWGEEVGRLAPCAVDNVKIPWTPAEERSDMTMRDTMANAIERIASQVSSCAAARTSATNQIYRKLYHFIPPTPSRRRLILDTTIAHTQRTC